MLFPWVGFAQNLIEVKGEYKMVLRRDATMTETERLCIEQARLRCIERECGLRIAESTVSTVKDNNGKSSDSFSSLSSTQVQGEWVADVTGPEVQWKCIGSGEMEVTAFVHGKVRPENVTHLASIFFKACMPCKPPHYVETFKNGQNLEAIFKSGNNGFLSIFYVDHADKMAYRILPDAAMSAMDAIAVNADEEYHLFDSGAPSGMRQSLVLGIPSDENMIQDELIVVFATTRYSKPMMSKPAQGALPALSTSDLQRWLTDLAGINSTVVKKSLSIPIYR